MTKMIYTAYLKPLICITVVMEIYYFVVGGAVIDLLLLLLLLFQLKTFVIGGSKMHNNKLYSLFFIEIGIILHSEAV